MGKGMNKYNKEKLIDELRFKTGIPKKDSKKVINGFIDILKDKFLEEGEHTVGIYGFGKFVKKKKSGGSYKTPQGDEGTYGDFYRIKFIPSQNLKEKLHKQAREAD